MALSNYIEDDWGDNALSGRTNASKDVFYQYGTGGTGDLLKGVYRPYWTVINGSVSATNSELQVPAGNTNVQAVSSASNLTTGEISFDFQFNSNPSSGEAAVMFFSKTTTIHVSHFEDSYSISFFNNGAANVKKDVNGSDLNFITGSWGDDTNNHTTKITRSSYGDFEAFVDGTSIGTATDTDITESSYTGVGNDSDVRLDFDNLVIK